MTPAVDRTSPPAARPPRPFDFPEFRRERLDNGLELIFAPHAGVPLLETSLLLAAGGERNPLDRPGLAALTAAVLAEGTAARSGLELACDLERLGGAFGSHADWNKAEVEISVHSRDVHTALTTLAELVRSPLFPEHEVERLRQQALVEVERRRDRPALLAEEALADALYSGTTYGFTLLGTAQSLRLLDRDQVVAFHARHYGPSDAHLLVGGEFDLDAVRAEVVKTFSDWRAPAVAALPPIAPKAQPRRRVIVVDRPEAAQTELRIGQIGPPKRHPDRARLGLLNAILGGKFTSRLNLNLRERHGFTYGASSRFANRRGPGPFVVATAVDNASVGAAVGEILGEIERIHDSPVSPTELAETQSFIRGVFPYSLQATDGLLGRLAEIALFELPSDHFQTVLREIDSASADDLLALARRHLTPELLVVVAAGPARDLASPLERYGPVEIRSVS